MYILDPNRYLKLEEFVQGRLYFLNKTRRWYLKSTKWWSIKQTRNNSAIIADALGVVVNDYLTGYNEFYDWLSLAKHDERFKVIEVEDLLNLLEKNNDL